MQNILENRLDIEKAATAVDDYFYSTGICVEIISTSGRILHQTEGFAEICEGCNKLHNRICQLQTAGVESNTDSKESHNKANGLKESIENTALDIANIDSIPRANAICRDIKLHGLSEAERFGGNYIYFCPISLIHWICPITIRGATVAALIAGPVLPVEEKDFFVKEFSKLYPGLFSEKNNYLEITQNDLQEVFKNTPYIEPARIKSLSEMLYMVSYYISDPEEGALSIAQEKMDIQSRVSEYVQYIKRLEGSELDKMAYPLEKEKLLLEHIKNGDRGEAQKVINEIMGYVFFAAAGNAELIKARVLELTVLLSRAALEGGADNEQIFGLNLRYLHQLYGMQNIDDIAYWLSRIMRRFTDSVFVLDKVIHTDVIYRGINYIKNNYSKKIALEEVASAVSLSPAYFSTLFKQEMNTTFTQFLNQYRAKKAAEHLLNNRVPLIDIAHLTGFGDQSYFTKVFKKVYGISPGKYRETRGNQVKRSK